MFKLQILPRNWNGEIIVQIMNGCLIENRWSFDSKKEADSFCAGFNHGIQYAIAQIPSNIKIEGS